MSQNTTEASEPREAWLHVRLTARERTALIDRAKRENVAISDLARAALAAAIGQSGPASEAQPAT